MMQQFEGDITKVWLIKTNQFWKVWILSFLMILSLASFFCMILTVNGIWIPDRSGELEFSLISIVLGFGSLIWFSMSLKCPKCGYRPTWPILKSAPANKWFVTITELEHCPNCDE